MLKKYIYIYEYRCFCNKNIKYLPMNIFLFLFFSRIYLVLYFKYLNKYEIVLLGFVSPVSYFMYLNLSKTILFMILLTVFIWWIIM